MARWAPARRDVLDALASEILHNYRHGRVLVAVDGAGGGRDTSTLPGSPEARGIDTVGFGADLAEALRRAGHDAVHASMRDFQAPRAGRELLGDDPALRYDRGYDEELLRRVLVEPFRLGGSTGFQLAGYDAARDTTPEPKWTTGPADMIAVVDGEFLLRPSLRSAWAWSVLLVAEDAATDAARADPAQQRYERDATPRLRAIATVDVTDPDHPRRRFSDSC